MKATGIVRRIDDLGRVVIPKEIRRTMRIREGDPVEIYTDKEGGVIFRKYSPMGELGDFAAQICETLGRSTGVCTAMADRDSIIAVHGIPKRELLEKPVSTELEQLMEARQPYLRQTGDRKLPLSSLSDKYHITAAAPILTAGDVMGCVLFFTDSDKLAGDVEQKLCLTVAAFLGKQMED